MTCPKEHKQFESRWACPAVLLLQMSGTRQVTGATKGKAQLCGGGFWFWPKAHDFKGLRSWWEEASVGVKRRK